MKKITTMLLMLLMFLGVSSNAQDLVISGVYDCTLSGGTPKGVELYVINSITDMSIYGLGSANNGGGSDGEEFTFPADSYSAGDFIYVSSEDVNFLVWFGFNTNYVTSAMGINGDDAVELFMNGGVVDVFGDINVDGSGEPWEYKDGWAYRVSGTGPDGTVFQLNNFTYSGPDALDGETSNATAAVPFPTGTYTPGSGAAAARIVGSMNSWSTTDPDYVMALNANGLYELTKSLDAGDHEYKVLEGDDWADPNFPANNEHVILTATEDVTWKANITTDFVINTLPVMAGDFMSAVGGNDWDPSDLLGEMTDPDGDETYTLELTIPAGDYNGKVTLNHGWVQTTSGDIPFSTDGVTPTTFIYDFLTNTTTISGPAPPTALFTFVVNDTESMNYDGFFLKGSWDASGYYDPSWGGGVEHSVFYDDGTNGDVVAGDHIWTCQQNLVVDGGSNTWEWGVNDTESNWVAGNWQFTVPDQTAQTLEWIIPAVADLVINEIMYNSPGADEEWIELYNNTDQTIDLENYNICDNDASHTHIVIPAGYTIDAYGYFTISVVTDGAFPFTPDYDGTGNFSLGNGGDGVRVWNADNLLVDVVNYDDSSPWPTSPDGDGPSLSLIDPVTDNSLPESWAPSNQDGGTPGAENFPPDAFVTVTYPNGGEYLTQGESYDITWIYGFWTGNIDIKLVRANGTIEMLGANISVDAGSWVWNVSPAQPAYSEYKILLEGTDAGDPSDESDDYFSVIEPYIMPEIVITEIMYNPPESGTDSLEFLELYNNGAETVNMAGFSFTEGIQYVFPNIELLPDNYLLVAVDSLAMMSTFGVEAQQWTSGGLSNGGEDIVLVDFYNNIIDSLDYDDALPWDTLADGYGPSLTLCNPDVDNSIAENWTHSVNFAAINTAGDSIWATPGFGCQVVLIPSFVADITYISIGEGVTFTDLTYGSPIEWTWTFEGGTPDTYFGQTPPTIVYNEEGVWDVTLLVTDGINTEEITYEDYITVVNLPAPTNLEAEVGPYDDVQLSWTAASLISKGQSYVTADLLGFNVYRDDQQINDELVLVTDYNDPEPTIGSHDYFVTAVYDGGESEPSNTVSVVVTDISEVDENVVSIYPNPTSGIFTIQIANKNIVDITIVDIRGKQVYNSQVIGNSQINIPDLNKGMYLIRLLDNSTNKLVVKKLIVK